MTHETTGWGRWFAWHRVVINDQTVWLRWVERRWLDRYHYDGFWEYRELCAPEKADNKASPSFGVTQHQQSERYRSNTAWTVTEPSVFGSATVNLKDSSRRGKKESVGGSQA